MKDLTPRAIVAELDRHIIGQDRAKRAVAVAVRNRWRRQRLDPAIAREVAPKNIVMIGPTGVGKTEIARRLSALVSAPFIKVEASKYTEVGYHGRDVESMVRDLLELGVTMVRQEHAAEVRQQAESAVENRLVNLLLGRSSEPGWEPPPADAETPGDAGGEASAWGPTPPAGPENAGAAAPENAGGTAAALATEPAPAATADRVGERMRRKLREGLLEEREIEITVREKQSVPIIGMMSPDQLDPGMASVIEHLVPDRSRRRRVTVARARAILLEDETDQLIDNEKVVEQAIERTEQTGIVFLDEIDKIAAGPGRGDGRGPDVSREGVQRDLLPIVEGCAVSTRYGVIHTDQVLFIAAGAFHGAAVSDMMPELQGRFPIRVELDPLTREDFRRILTEPDAALTRQQQALLGTEGLDVQFQPDSIDAMAELAADANTRMENIGARRLMTVIEQVFEQISFDAPDLARRGEKAITITADFVRERLEATLKDEDLSRFIL